MAAFNAVNRQTHRDLYTCGVSLSPTQLELAQAIGLDYDPAEPTGYVPPCSSSAG